ncbi:MAG: queuosine precursor transporter, partial [Candidatus Moranbacteria bacterium]|nr:queuosine precursor transporter [Candidatus Moranbacteria bacterium]
PFMEKLIKERKLNLFVLSSSLYVSFQLFANILSTKIAILPYFNLAIDGGTVIYPLTFTLRDFVHKTHGKKDARQVIIIAAALNAVMFGLFWLVGKMTPDPTWQFQRAYEQILLPVGRIVLASIIAQVISELIDTEIFSRVYKKTSDAVAVFSSNSISLVVDSFIFSFIAFLGVLPFATVMQIFVANILVKFVISTLSVPTIKLIPRTAKFEDI